MATFPQIHQQDAPPEIAAIYADIQAVSGVPTVNLIWRHFAALPGVLPWAWAAVSSLVGSTAIDAARRRIAAAIALPQVAPLRTSAWRAAGVGAEAIEDLTTVAEAYVRGNLTNIIALTALRRRLECPDQPPSRIPVSKAGARALAPLRPLPRIDHLEAGLAARVRALAARHNGTGAGVIPSLYLELAHWPGVIEALPEWLSELYQPETLRAARAATCRLAETEAEVLLPRLGPRPEGLAAMQPALQRFTRLVIPDLIPVCIALRRLLPEHNSAISYGGHVTDLSPGT